ncbi:MAG: Flp pilus assembly protein CpaB [Alphaproteobacteria bacterium]|nr:Flp pilus assembly protein CpaB [Alphaproteobacteria bacterium]
MRIGFALILIVGMGLAGFAVYLAQGQFNEYKTRLSDQSVALKKNVPLVRVFVSTKPLRYGQKLTKEDVRIVAWPEDAIPEGAFTDPKILFSEDETILRTVLRAMEKDEAILAVKVTEPGEDAGVASRLSAGMRAFTISVNVATGVSGFLRPGDRVDVYWSGSISGRDVTRLILEDIKLIAIDQTADGDSTSTIVARTVTAEVSPKVVASLAQAQATGKLLLSLRGSEDTTLLGQIEVDQEQLLGIQKEVVVKAKRKKVCTIKTRKGADVVEIAIPCPEE